MTSALSWTRRLTADHRSTLAFRHERNGVAGWATLLALGAVAGGLAGGLAGGPVRAGATSGRRPVARLAAGIGLGAAAGVLLGRVIDEIRWRWVPVSLAVDEPDTALDLMQAVRARGMQADMVRADRNSDEGPGHHPVDHRPGDSGSTGHHRYALRYRAKDDRRIRAVLAEQQH